MATNSFIHYIISNAVSMAIDSFQRPIIVGYDSIEGDIALLMPFCYIADVLQRRR